ncbi:TonB-dependent receptor [Novosphingobium sp. 1949]|uniref:TonB-dependent receptor n=1 Tax=Novosphingobium organovorum TaxID=2930092 RepID=A0ABT0BEX5_9SPHN|nr:TonB-dependent receptor [Novosphingobium organovorum]MCJ2183581.1 TonB-dependent receptor [Novosphingobium organovorum]
MTSAMAIVVAVSSPALARAADTAEAAGKDATAEDATAEDYDNASIVVTGVRGSVEKAAEKKKKAAQIVDSVVAEDVGKLPDNNVPEAIARVAGVQISREHGEGTDISIRGMTDISTTINGYEATTGVGRSMTMADIPAELIKAVDVYKTRTPDQVEGGIAGTVNVELRRPLDLEQGLTVAGSFREVFSSIGNTKSPYGSLLVADRFDTAIGEMGFLINASYTKNHYNETFAESETPGTFFSTDAESLDADTAGTTIAPYAVNYGVEQGRIKRPSINAVWQWQATPELDFVVEGTYFSSHEKIARDRLHLTVRNGNYDLSDLSYVDNGNSDYQTVGSVTETAASGSIVGGPQSYYERNYSDNYNGNFEAHWHGDHTKINFSTQYNKSRREYYGILTEYRFNSLDSATVDFDCSIGGGVGPCVSFNGVDLSDPSQYSLYNVHDERGLEHSKNFASQVDVTQDLSDTGLLRTFQMGVRYSNRKISYRYGYRDSYPEVDGEMVSLTDFGYPYETTSPDLAGVSSWYHLTGSSLMRNFSSIRDWLQDNATSGDWSTQYPSLNLGSGYASHEQSFAAYGQFNYAFDIGVPIDGVFGARVVNTWGNSSSASYSYDDDWNETITNSSGKGNYLDILPSFNAIVHFTPKLQLRLAWTKNVSRLDFYALSSYRIVQSANSIVYAGNPDLKAYTENSYDASLEYYFGKAGSLSFAAYLKKPKGYIYYSGETEYIPELGDYGTVYTNRNAGGGTFQGFELAGQTFFDFLPGIWSNFGVSGNLTWLRKGNIQYPDGEDDNAVGMSKLTYNAALYYDDHRFSARVAWNYRSRYRTAVFSDYPEYSPYMDATSRLDAAINYTPKEFVTFSLEATNLLKDNAQMWWGKDRLLPYGVRLQARTIQTGVRFRF